MTIGDCGAVYDGDGNLVAGEGPPFSLELVAALPFQAVLHDQENPENSMAPRDRLWLLPEQAGTGLRVPEQLLADLAATIRAGRKVLVMGHDGDLGEQACAAVEHMLDTAHGNA
ncbi:hypothetical protein [Roseomonas elaeocarpi]|uniref:Uncharacterized protein n=1 Tax=Roseomonas elaeocarpi TaxID=907779 RepID=A0ABV6JY07_9PROT